MLSSFPGPTDAQRITPSPHVTMPKTTASAHGPGSAFCPFTLGGVCSQLVGSVLAPTLSAGHPPPLVMGGCWWGCARCCRACCRWLVVTGPIAPKDPAVEWWVVAVARQVAPAGCTGGGWWWLPVALPIVLRPWVIGLCPGWPALWPVGLACWFDLAGWVALVCPWLVGWLACRLGCLVALVGWVGRLVCGWCVVGAVVVAGAVAGVAGLVSVAGGTEHQGRHRAWQRFPVRQSAIFGVRLLTFNRRNSAGAPAVFPQLTYSVWREISQP